MKAPEETLFTGQTTGGIETHDPKLSLISSIIQNPASFCLRGGVKRDQGPEVLLTSQGGAQEFPNGTVQHKFPSSLPGAQTELTALASVGLFSIVAVSSTIS